MTNSGIIMTRGVMVCAPFKLMYQQPCYCHQWYFYGSVMTNSSIVVTRGLMNSAPFKRYKIVQVILFGFSIRTRNHNIV